MADRNVALVTHLGGYILETGWSSFRHLHGGRRSSTPMSIPKSIFHRDRSRLG